MRSADTAARGIMIVVNAAMSTPPRIRPTYCMKANSVPICTLALVDLDGAEPDHADDVTLSTSMKKREQRDEERADAAPDVHDVGVGAAEPLLLDALAHERAHHADAGELLAQDAVHGVELRSGKTAEQRHHAER